MIIQSFSMSISRRPGTNVVTRSIDNVRGSRRSRAPFFIVLSLKFSRKTNHARATYMHAVSPVQQKCARVTAGSLGMQREPHEPVTSVIIIVTTAPAYIIIIKYVYIVMPTEERKKKKREKNDHCFFFAARFVNRIRVPYIIIMFISAIATHCGLCSNSYVILEVLIHTPVHRFLALLLCGWWR